MKLSLSMLTLPILLILISLLSILFTGCCDSRTARALEECTSELFVCTQKVVNCECATKLDYGGPSEDE